MGFSFRMLWEAIILFILLNYYLFGLRSNLRTSRTVGRVNIVCKKGFLRMHNGFLQFGKVF